MQEKIVEFFANPLVRSGTIIAGSFLAALLVNVILSRYAVLLTRKTKTDLDDQLINALKRPLFISILLIGVAWASLQFKVKPSYAFVLYGILKTVAVLVWASAGLRLGTAILQLISRHAGKVALIQPRTLPIFEILVKMLVIGGALYFFFLAWKINVTGWLASAGIVGIAVGFAAKDTLANLFAGFFILADAPYKLGDFIILENGLRGRITDIGIRSTRLLTRDDIEITIPNAIMGNAKITNETKGPSPSFRVRIPVSVAYDSDLARVRAALQEIGETNPLVLEAPEPRVRFRSFGDSGLLIELLCWIEEPVLKGRAVDALNTAVFERFAAEGIEIPFPKRDLYLKDSRQKVEVS